MKRLALFLLVVGACSITALLCAQESKTLELTSPAFKNQEAITYQFTCHAKDVNPELEIANVPEQAKSLALIVDDPDAPEGTWVHWVVYNIPPNTTKIAENSKVGTEGLNDFGTFHYHGPCPANKKLHHYSFRLYALSENLSLVDGSIKSDLEGAMKGKILAQAELVGTFQNPKKD